MALTWNVSKVKNYKVVTTDPNDPNKWAPVTRALITLTIPLGMNHITEKNYEEFFARVVATELVNGPMLYKVTKDGKVDTPITIEDVYAHIGLTTNASSGSKARFWNGITKDILGRSEVREFRKKLAAQEG